MFNLKFGGISAIIICLLLISPLILLAQNEGDSDQSDGGGFEIVRTHVGDVFDIQIADVDRDHNADIIYTGMSDTYLHVLYGKKEGGFEFPVCYSEGGHTLTTAYINDDKYLDIICSFIPSSAFVSFELLDTLKIKTSQTILLLLLL